MSHCYCPVPYFADRGCLLLLFGTPLLLSALLCWFDEPLLLPRALASAQGKKETLCLVLLF